ncbi:hypothetical protein GLW05_20965 [Pontibacillus yanchengensis]|uniref:Uncharacterized protein n=1 Tax=Pontibacillus yanchengensis TaxID=462910 RepID=A0A6I5A6P3_9BACI|nr:hypothetical protein [Pontibacillus yanchengensis]MYL36046.1 hypothetical protein [Pontibacillus yanchengensis]
MGDVVTVHFKKKDEYYFTENCAGCTKVLEDVDEETCVELEHDTYVEVIALCSSCYTTVKQYGVL